MNFISFKKNVKRILFSRYGVTLEDLSIEDEHLQLAFESDEKAGELAYWYGEKYDLDRL